MKLQGLLSKVRYMAALAIATLAGVQTVHAQQEVQYSQYMFNMLAVNPAYAGSRDVLSMTGLYRQQWVGLEGAPTTQSFTIDMPISKEKVGIGLCFVCVSSESFAENNFINGCSGGSY
jgi:type IX secretion system PorP/SprF family membrane protein